MARYEHLPIYKQALDVAVHFERVVTGFYSGHPALRPAGRAPRVQNRSRRFCRRYHTPPWVPSCAP